MASTGIVYGSTDAKFGVSTYMVHVGQTRLDQLYTASYIHNFISCVYIIVLFTLQ